MESRHKTKGKNDLGLVGLAYPAGRFGESCASPRLMKSSGKGMFKQSEVGCLSEEGARIHLQTPPHQQRDLNVWFSNN